ncbi:MAG: TonB-dependent receptor [Acidobacteriota bacterium]
MPLSISSTFLRIFASPLLIILFLAPSTASNKIYAEEKRNVAGVKYEEEHQAKSSITIDDSESDFRVRVQTGREKGFSYGINFKSDDFERLPTSRSIWQILELLEPATYTNFLDHAGIKGGLQSLMGIHGSSWTQNSFFLNEMDFTDPYDGGRALFIPEFSAVKEIQVSTGFHPVDVGRPGGAIDILTVWNDSWWDGDQAEKDQDSSMRWKSQDDQQERMINKWQGSFQSYYLGSSTQSSAKSFPEVRGHPPFIEEFLRKGRLEFQAKGPLLPERFYLFASATREESEMKISAYQRIPEIVLGTAFLETGLILSDNERMTFLASSQDYRNTDYLAGPLKSPEATLKKKDSYALFQISWDRDCSEQFSIHARGGYARLRLKHLFNGSSQSTEELFFGQMRGSASLQERSTRSKQIVQFAGSYFNEGNDGKESKISQTFFERLDHRLNFGISLDRSFIDSEISAIDDVNLLFYKGEPFAVRRLNTLIKPEESLRNLSLYLSDEISIASHFKFYAGVRFEWNQGILPEQESPAGNFIPPGTLPSSRKLIDWKSFSPRLRISVPIIKEERLVFKAGFSRYYHRLLGRHLEVANPNSLGGELYLWDDMNGDDRYQRGEESGILKSFGGPYTEVSKNLKQPYTDELLFGLEFQTKKKALWKFFAYQRDEHRLMETVNDGVPFSSYIPVEIFDPGDDELPETGDEQTLIVYNQDPATFGKDRYILENPPRHGSYAQGFEITGEKRGKNYWWLFSFVVARSVAMGNPGNTEYDNDQGIIGELYDNPNSLINSRGRLFFDRAFTSRFAFHYHLPRNFSVAAVARWWDGLPFGRRIIIEGLNQGPIVIQSRRRGLSRTEAYITLDTRVEKLFPLGKSKLVLLLDLFNLLNSQFHLREDDLAGDTFTERRPTEIMPPRVLRLSLQYQY